MWRGFLFIWGKKFSNHKKKRKKVILEDYSLSGILIQEQIQ